MTWLELELHALDVARSAAGLCANWFIQSTLLIAAGLLIGAALRSRGSAVQSAVYRTTLVAVLVCPLVSWGLTRLGASGWSLEMPAAYTHQVQIDSPPAEREPTFDPPPEMAAAPPLSAPFDSAPEPAVLQPFGDEATASELAEPVDFALPRPESSPIVPEIAPDMPVPAPTFSIQWFGTTAIAASAAWVIASGWLLVRLASSWRKLIYLRRGAAPADATTRDACRQVASLFHVEAPDVLHSPYWPSPCLAGLRRPAVLLPGAEVSLPLRDVLIHELAHLARGDCYWNLLRRAATAVLFFQPLIWLLSRRLDSTAEEVCDDYVVEFGGDRREYAHRLVDIAELSLAPMAAAGVGIVSLRSMLAARVARIMDTSRSLSTRIGSLLLAIVLLAGLTATLVVGLVGVEPKRVIAEPTPSEIASDEDVRRDEPSVDVGDAESLPDDDVITVRGRVVDDEGRPVTGARVTAGQARWLDGQYVHADHRQVGETRTDADGEFEFTIPKVEFSDLGKNRLSPFDWKPVTITATAPGYAPAWVGGEWYREGDDPLAGDLVLRLKKQSPTIRGRLVNLEGQPQAGLSVKVMSLAAAEPGKVDQWLADVERLRNEGKLPRADAGAYSIFAMAMVANHQDDAAKDRRSAYFPTKWRLLAGNPIFPAAVRTDVDGRFELDGLPPDCLAELQISGPGVATQSVSVVTRSIPKIDVPNTGFAGGDAHGYHGAEFDYAAAPGTAIFGTVTDTESGEPIPGVRVDAHAIVNRMQIDNATWTSLTDAQGRFRIEGLPVGGEKQLDVIPKPDQPYLSHLSIKVADSSELAPIETNVKLRRGILVRGKVTVAETGEPVDATLHYHPFLNNEFAKQYDRYDPQVYRYEGNDTRYRTKADGSFQTVVIPGRGILAVQTIVRGEYCIGLGGEAFETGPEGRSPVYNLGPPYQRVLEIDVPPDAKVLEYNLSISRGVSITYAVNDPQGEPLSGVLVSGVTPDRGPSTEPSPDASVEFKALRPGETRRVLLLHRERRLGRVIDVVAPQSADNDHQPQSVTLLPCSTVKGRLVNGEGDPVTGLMLAAYGIPMGNLNMISPQQVATDTNGEFQLDLLPVGSKYRVVGNSPEYGSVEVLKEFEFEPGETIDLGTVDVTSEQRPEPKRVKPTFASKASARNSSGTDSSASDVDVIAIHGRVVDQDGKAVAGAAVRLPDDVSTEGQSATTDSDGRFQIEFDKARFNQPDWHKESWRHARLVATADGFTPTWLEGEELAANPRPTIKLKRGDVPIRGQILTLEGQPVPHGRLVIWDIQKPRDGSLDGLFKALRKSPLTVHTIQTYLSREASWFPSRLLDLHVTRGTLDRTNDGAVITADDEGRFEFAGIGVERLARGQIQGRNIQTMEIKIVTRTEVEDWWNREALDESTRRMLDSGDRLPQIYAATFKHFASPSVPIVGTVRDRQTREPIRGMGIMGAIRGAGDHASAVTDENGRYELTGLATNGTLRLFVGPAEAANLPYVGVERSVEISAGSPPKSQATEFELMRGILLRGKVTEAATGQPVKARVEYLASAANPHLKDIADELWPYGSPITDDNGEFATVVLPGPGALAVWTTLSSQVPDRYRPSDPQDFGLPISADGWISTANHGLISPIHYKATKFINFERGDAPPFIELTVNPMTDVARVRCVDSAGRPLREVSVTGHLPWSGNYPEIPHGGLEAGRDGNTYIEVAELGAESRRPVVFRHREQKLAAILFPSPSERTPRLVDLKRAEDGAYLLQLPPSATITARLVDAKGNPASEASVELHLAMGRGLRIDSPLARPYVNEQGRFELRDVPAGGPYWLAVGGEGFAGGIVKQDVTLTAGQTLDLGDVDITKAERPQQDVTTDP